MCITSTIKLKVQTSEWFDVNKDFLVMILSSQDNKILSYKAIIFQIRK